MTELVFPAAEPRILRVERTFWERATAVHVFCLQGRVRGHRFSRHWHDLARLDEAGLVDAALLERELAVAVARHKTMFFAEKDKDGKPVDYEAAVAGRLSLVPEGDAYEALADDYRQMVDDGLLLTDPETFEALMERCRRVEEKSNK